MFHTPPPSFFPHIRRAAAPAGQLGEWSVSSDIWDWELCDEWEKGRRIILFPEGQYPETGRSF